MPASEIKEITLGDIKQCMYSNTTFTYIVPFYLKDINGGYLNMLNYDFNIENEEQGQSEVFISSSIMYVDKSNNNLIIKYDSSHYLF